MRLKLEQGRWYDVLLESGTRATLCYEGFVTSSGRMFHDAEGMPWHFKTGGIVEATPCDHPAASKGSDQSRTLDCECEHNCQCYPEPESLADSETLVRWIREGLDTMRTEAPDDLDMIIACASNHTDPKAPAHLKFYACEGTDGVSFGALDGESRGPGDIPLRFVKLGEGYRPDEESQWYYQAEIDVEACVAACR